ncbi:MAG: hypothetical protein DRQ98_13125 [Gammaproteobacteria bacterium]|nr:MAG: hypothetical protein DRQ98_13125 [Gammaproteobacteria bacterium]
MIEVELYEVGVVDYYVIFIRGPNTKLFGRREYKDRWIRWGEREKLNEALAKKNDLENAGDYEVRIDEIARIRRRIA